MDTRSSPKWSDDFAHHFTYRNVSPEEHKKKNKAKANMATGVGVGEDITDLQLELLILGFIMMIFAILSTIALAVLLGLAIRATMNFCDQCVDSFVEFCYRLFEQPEIEDEGSASTVKTEDVGLAECLLSLKPLYELVLEREVFRVGYLRLVEREEEEEKKKKEDKVEESWDSVSNEETAVVASKQTIALPYRAKKDADIEPQGRLRSARDFATRDGRQLQSASFVNPKDICVGTDEEKLLDFQKSRNAKGRVGTFPIPYEYREAVVEQAQAVVDHAQVVISPEEYLSSGVQNNAFSESTFSDTTLVSGKEMYSNAHGSSDEGSLSTPDSITPNVQAQTNHYCLSCHKTFPSLRQLKKHSRYHTKPHECSECPQRFGTSKDLKRHQNGSHPTSNSTRFYCRFYCLIAGCKHFAENETRIGFARKDNLKRHVKMQHGLEAGNNCWAVSIDKAGEEKGWMERVE